MPVERRYSKRIRVDYEVELGYRGRRLPNAKARNLSPEGIYIALDNLTLPSGTLLELEIRRWGREWFVPAIVVHGDSRGVGLMFREPQPVLYQNELQARSCVSVRPGVVDAASATARGAVE